MVSNGDSGLIYKTKNGGVVIEASDTPAPGDEILISPTGDGQYVTHGASPTPKVGDEGLIVQTENGPVYISGGIQGCDPQNVNAWKWRPAGIDPSMWQGKNLNQLTIFWTSNEFKAINFDIEFIGYCKIWAFGEVVLDMISPTDENGYAVPFHFQRICYSDNPCGARACRLELRMAGIMNFATLSGTVLELLGRNGSAGPTHIEVVEE